MAIVLKFNCYVCGKPFRMACGGLFSNHMPSACECVCPSCVAKQKALEKARERQKNGLQFPY